MDEFCVVRVTSLTDGAVINGCKLASVRPCIPEGDLLLTIRDRGGVLDCYCLANVEHCSTAHSTSTQVHVSIKLMSQTSAFCAAVKFVPLSGN